MTVAPVRRFQVLEIHKTRAAPVAREIPPYCVHASDVGNGVTVEALEAQTQPLGQPVKTEGWAGTFAAGQAATQDEETPRTA